MCIRCGYPLKPQKRLRIQSGAITGYLYQVVVTWFVESARRHRSPPE